MKNISAGSHIHYHVHLGTEFWKCDKLGRAQSTHLEVQVLVMKDASMLSKQITSTFQKKYLIYKMSSEKALT